MIDASASCSGDRASPFPRPLSSAERPPLPAGGAATPSKLRPAGGSLASAGGSLKPAAKEQASLAGMVHWVLRLLPGVLLDRQCTCGRRRQPRHAVRSALRASLSTAACPSKLPALSVCHHAGPPCSAGAVQGV